MSYYTLTNLTFYCSWIQLKTVLPLGVEIKKYGIDVSEQFAMKVIGSDGVLYACKFELFQPSLQWYAVPLSNTVIKVIDHR